MSESATYTHTLNFPIEIRNKETGEVIETIRELKIQRFKGKHLKAADKAIGDSAKTLALIAAAAGIPVAYLDEMDVEDLSNLSEVLESFFGKPLPLATGRTSSAH